MATTIHDLPDAILTNILAMIADVRSRNAAALVNKKWSSIERQTRTHLTLRGNIKDLLFRVNSSKKTSHFLCEEKVLPKCFTNVTHLDISLLSPWGWCLSSIATAASFDYEELAFLLSRSLQQAFPEVRWLRLYSRSPLSISLVSQAFPSLREVELVRWHQRPQQIGLGSDFDELFHSCVNLCSIDLSCFYCWTEDVPPALEGYPGIGVNLFCLNLLNFALPEGYKSDQIMNITTLCPNLREFKVGCTFDPRYHLGFVRDETLLAVAANCSHLRVLHLVDISTGDREFDDQGFCSEDAGFSMQGLVGFFGGLREIEELVFDAGNNVRGSWVGLEALASKCPKLRVLELGCFHGICKAIESHLDGIALCHRLESLSIKNSADLTDLGLIAIGRGCSRLSRFEVSECGSITMRGLRTMVCLLRKTLVEVKISGCKYLDAFSSLQAVDPICDQIRRLHIDCVWDGLKPDIGEELALAESTFDLNGSVDDNDDDDDDGELEEGRIRKRPRVSLDGGSWYSNGGSSGFAMKSWKRLEFLSLWIGVGERLIPLADAGLEFCPNLSEIHIKVEGDCRERQKPSQDSFGISSLVRYPKLSKMKMNCGDTIGYALTAPSGHKDLSLWERWLLNGIEDLRLNELEYWPPHDRDVNQRSLSLPAVGNISRCGTLRKLFIHGTTHEHFINFLLNIPNLRDVQLRFDYYPAPENDMSTEMRGDSTCRFEDKLNARQIPD